MSTGSNERGLSWWLGYVILSDHSISQSVTVLTNVVGTVTVGGGRVVVGL